MIRQGSTVSLGPTIRDNMASLGHMVRQGSTVSQGSMIRQGSMFSLVLTVRENSTVPEYMAREVSTASQGHMAREMNTASPGYTVREMNTARREHMAGETNTASQEPMTSQDSITGRVLMARVMSMEVRRHMGKMARGVSMHSRMPTASLVHMASREIRKKVAENVKVRKMHRNICRRMISRGKV